MNPKTGSFLKALTTRFHPKNGTSFLRFLPSSEAEDFKALQISDSFDFEKVLSLAKNLQPIHYSWFLTHFKKVPSPTQSLLLSILSPEQASGIKKNLQISPSSSVLPRFSQNFLLLFLKNQIYQKEILAEEELPPSELNGLLKLSKAELVHLIDLLSMFDLAADLRHVVDKNLLGKIYGALRQDQLHFLHYCMKQPIKWIPPKLNIAGWDGSKKSLLHILHARGLFRLAKALVNEHPSLSWHVCHHLDTGRGAILTKLFSGKHDPAMIPYFKSQVLHLIKRYRR